MKKNTKTIQKFAKIITQNVEIPKEKVEPQTFQTIHTHTLQQCQAQILLPVRYHNFMEKEIIIVGTKQPIIAQVCKISKSVQTQSISILRTLCDIANIQYQQNFKFKSTIRKLEKVDDYPIEFIQLLVRETYISRRDQYKINDHFQNIHVYAGKIINFEGLKLTIMNILTNNQIIKRGIISKNTKIIYRTSCSKNTLLLEISKEIFQLDYNQQIYVEKVIQFLTALYQRNNFFQNTHRIEIVMFARLYYPQFNSLNNAYDGMIKARDELSKSSKKSDLNSYNLAIAFQVDGYGKIYQDCYRKIIWKKNYGSLGSYLWKKIGQFLFTINWKKNLSNVAEFILKRVKIQMDKNQDYSDGSSGSSSRRKRSISDLGDDKHKIRPFIHFLESELSNSQNSNILQAINLASQQYSKHYYGRSVVQSGNSIIIISAGYSKYITDSTTYRLAKSNVYLMNTNCLHVNLRTRKQKLQFKRLEKIYYPVYCPQNSDTKMNHLIYSCLKEYIYSTPLNQRINYAVDNYENRMGIDVEKLKQINEMNHKKFFEHFDLKILNCNHLTHFIKQQSNQKQQKDVQFIIKYPNWIQCCYFNEQAFKTHTKLYEKLNEEIKNYESQKSKKIKGTDKEKFLKIHEELQRFNCYDEVRQFETNRKINSIQNKIFLSISKNQAQKNQFQNINNKELFKLQVLKDEEILERKTSISSYSSENKYKKSIKEDNEQNLGRNSLGKINIFQKLKVNIFEVEAYDSSKFDKIPTAITFPKNNINHYQCRLQKNYKDSKIHYFMNNYKENYIKLFKKTMLRKQESGNEEKRIFQLEYFWKMICFPLLTPIKASYNISKIDYVWRDAQTDCNVQDIQQLICQKLMENFQLVQEMGQKKTHSHIEQTYHLAKGDLYFPITIRDRININKTQCQVIKRKFQQTDKNKQIEIIRKFHSSMLYKYLCYEQKQFRFVNKYIYFHDSNTWTKTKNLKNKMIKISFIIDTTNQLTIDREKARYQCAQNFKQYIQAINEKYQPFIPNFNLNVSQQNHKEKSDIGVLKIKPLNLNKNIHIFQKDEFEFCYQKIWNLKTTFNIELQWKGCMSVFINQFLKYLLIMGKVNKKILSFQVPSHNVFQTQWNFQSPAQIIFQYRISMDLLEKVMEQEWIWDRCGYHFHKRGLSFVKFYKQKKLLLWKDNIKQIMDLNQQSSSNIFFEFYMKACAYDIIGEILHMNIFNK